MTSCSAEEPVLFLLAGLITPNRIYFAQNSSPTSTSSVSYFTNAAKDFLRNSKTSLTAMKMIPDKVKATFNLPEHEDPAVADEIQKHTTRFLKFLLEFKYDYTHSKTDEPVVVLSQSSLGWMKSNDKLLSLDELEASKSNDLVRVKSI